jgi:predicted Na+-dependent transporter
MYVVVPIAAYFLVLVIPLAPGVKAALLVLAVSAGAPLLPRKLAAFQNETYVISLVVASSLLAIVTVPAWVAVFSLLFGVTTTLSPDRVAIVMAKAFLLPLVIGMILRKIAPGLSQRVADRILAMAGSGLFVAAGLLLVLQWRILLDLQWHGLLALLALVLIALAIGHSLGGPDPDQRAVLATACATRHVGIAVIVATTFRGPGTLLILAVYTMVTMSVSIPYLRWLRRKARAAPLPPGRV